MKYEGKALQKPFIRDGIQEIDPYFPDPELVEAVNLARYLKRPLLLMGEPGCGKTRLAEAVAFEIHGADYHQYLVPWYVKSTTKAKDGVYTFDAIARLRLTELEKDSDALRQQLQLEGKELEAFYLKNNIISKGPLSQAFDLSKAEKPAILLIDEVDKADIDFPNDLLLELDKTTYYITETKTYTKRLKADSPLIIITSNNEKELPPAFLRRCLFHYIKFPLEPQLRQILDGLFAEAPTGLKEDSIKAFVMLRERLIQGLSQKKLSTSELIDWFDALQHQHQNNLSIDGQPIDQALKQTIDELTKRSPKVPLPLHQVLLKNWEAVLSILAEKKAEN
ncbi:MAG: MoxR family ATPase [Bacteroidota bacterium]